MPLYKEEHMDKLPGAHFWLPMHPACAQCKTLISNTAYMYFHIFKGPLQFTLFSLVSFRKAKVLEFRGIKCIRDEVFIQKGKKLKEC